MNPKQKIFAARNLFESFIPLSSYLCVNISSSERSSLITLFELSDGELVDKLTATIFDDILDETEKMMVGSFQRYIRSDMYQRQIAGAPTMAWA